MFAGFHAQTDLGQISLLHVRGHGRQFRLFRRHSPIHQCRQRGTGGPLRGRHHVAVLYGHVHQRGSSLPQCFRSQRVTDETQSLNPRQDESKSFQFRRDKQKMILN